MKNAELTERLARKTDIPTRKAAEIMRALEEIVIEEVANGEKVVMTRFGTFQTVTRAPRKWRNPKTGIIETLPTIRGILFCPSRNFRQTIHGEDNATDKE